jgi:dephospho-CoA kinase
MTVKRIGMAGYMGAGKTEAARFLAERTDAAIIDADQEAKALMNTDQGIREQLNRAFGGSIIRKGEILFPVLGSIVFGSKEKLLLLNSIVHPLLVTRLRGLLYAHGGRSIVLDAALLPLWKMESLFDALLWVHAPFEIRLERLKKVRSDLNEQSLRPRMRIQEECLPVPRCPPWRLIHNAGNREHLAEMLAGTICIL